MRIQVVSDLHLEFHSPLPPLAEGGDFALTAGWGHFGQGDAVMPGQGQGVERSYTPGERATFKDAITILGKTTFDICLNRRTWWRNVPAAVWRYKLGGYQVLKKWLSYRERDPHRSRREIAPGRAAASCARRAAWSSGHGREEVSVSGISSGSPAFEGHVCFPSRSTFAKGHVS